jgi:hypothetical protein
MTRILVQHYNNDQNSTLSLCRPNYLSTQKSISSLSSVPSPPALESMISRDGYMADFGPAPATFEPASAEDVSPVDVGCTPVIIKSRNKGYPTTHREGDRS